VVYSWNERRYPLDIFRMLEVSNHDVHAWEQTGFKAFGEAQRASMALSVVGEGMLMIYNGQEAGNPKQRAFLSATLLSGVNMKTSCCIKNFWR
jgi:hypothetical protein